MKKMTREEVEGLVKDVIVEQLGLSEVEAANIKPTSTLEDDLGVDSLDKVEIVIALEDNAECEIDDETLEKWSTVDDVVNSICEAVRS